ncbi:phasin, PhaP [Psychromarinibacter sp. S121]|uniref:phasin, PhaP n=1 Tax=Psychromarinibacter sp. S121 TaxID=3415127 RepID=UPI003C7B5517
MAKSTTGKGGMSDPFGNVDMGSMMEQIKGSAVVGEKLSKAALDAAEKASELSSSWTKQTIANMGDVTSVKDDPTDYAKAMTDFASSQGALAQENLNAFAQIAQALQEQTISILMEASSSMGGDAAEAVQKAADMMGMKGPGSK